MHVVADITHSNCGEDANQCTSTAVLKSDLQLDVLKISSSSMSNKTRDFNSKLQQLEAKCPKWYHVIGTIHSHAGQAHSEFPS